MDMWDPVSRRDLGSRQARFESQTCCCKAEYLVWQSCVAFNSQNLPNFPKGISKVFWFWWILESCTLLFWINERQRWSKMTQDLLDQQPLMTFFVGFSNSLGFSACVINNFAAQSNVFYSQEILVPPSGMVCHGFGDAPRTFFNFNDPHTASYWVCYQTLKKQSCLYTSAVFGLWSEIEGF